ncbi:hypothetical protein BS329_36050 [Amycolatopsis coloradensis]|uniref:Uncharacterized protein n=1 Tax=Amycolatopsis coloradensis TaxID=76021 RepID=A0A1R0KG25_9PSEU|nr:DUF6002 family protein [Amycolatopsis coloradensis]OLZ44498.1 hypothetical protein BS329_36050 [Amycolatopsis coloradensis]
MSRTDQPDAGVVRAAHAVRTGNLITDFYDEVRELSAATWPAPARDDPARFGVGGVLPDLTPAVREYFAAAEASWHEMGSYRGHELMLLNLARNPGTNTTKTFASLLIVARAAEFVRQHGEPVVIFSPTSANKGTALRDALARAVSCGLVQPDQLRVVVLAPAANIAKLRTDALSADPRLAELNPLLTYDDPVAENVKVLGRRFVDEYAETLLRQHGRHLWYSLDLDNYLVADVGRALFEHAVAPVDKADRQRTHAHAVSSAFGLLGYHLGRDRLERDGQSDPMRRPHSLLVQHLGTPDMVLHLRHGDFDRDRVPRYRLDPATGRHEQRSDPRFPYHTGDPGEVLDPTFYTRRPATANRMTDIINRHGGDGIVVSELECRQRYPELSPLLTDAGFPVPADPAAVREWSLMMALTGVLNGIDRGLVDSAHDVVVHGSGWYTDEDMKPLTERGVTPVSSAEEVFKYVSAGSGPW